MTAKAKLMLASPRLGPKPVVLPEKREESKHAMLTPTSNDLLDVAVRIQSAKDLETWWEAITDFLEERYDATRAELAVPTANCEGETKVWSQLASFNRGGDESGIPTKTPSAASMTPTSSKQSRPKLGSRHSFQGYPSPSPSPEASLGRPNKPSLRRPGLPRTNSSENANHRLALPQVSPGGGMLSPTSLKRHFLEPYELQGENIRSYRAPPGEEGAKVFPETRSLNGEPYALLTPHDVTKCLEREGAYNHNIEQNGSVVYVPLTGVSPTANVRRPRSSCQHQPSRATHSPKMSMLGGEDHPASPSLGIQGDGKFDPSAIISILSRRRLSSVESSDIVQFAPFLASTLHSFRKVHRLENQVARAQEEAKKKMTYLHTMSHELRTPLNGMIGNMQLMSNSLLSDHQHDWVQGALNAARGMNEVLNDILDVAKAEARMLTLGSDWFRIRSTMEEVVETLGSQANEKHLELCYEIHESVPDMIKGDSMRIRQVLLNLVGNAIKFTRRGEIYFDCRTVEKSASSVEERVEQPEITLAFRVIDSGCGFSDENAKLLFRPYSQINNSATRANKGTGLGLTLCKQMVELHGGQISATSKGLGQGSIFTFTARFRLPSGRDHPDLLRTLSQNSVIQGQGQPNRSLVSSPDQLNIGAVVNPPSHINPHMRPQLLSTRSESLLGSPMLAPRDKTAEPLVGRSDPPVPRNTQRVASASQHPSSYNILIVCPQEHTLRTTKAYIEQVLPKSVPCRITTHSSEDISSHLSAGQDLLPYSHIVLQLPEADQVLAFMDFILGSATGRHVSLIIVTDQQQESTIKQRAEFDFDQPAAEQHVTFILKPTKPPKFAKIFDPQGKSATSIEYQRANVKESKAQAYQRFKEKLEPLQIRALAVEDNCTNMRLLSTFLSRFCGCEVVEAIDGKQCTDLVFSHPPLYYSIIIVSHHLSLFHASLTERTVRH